MGKVKVKIEERNGREYVCDIPLEKFPQGYECFLDTDAPNTMRVEAEGAEFLGKCLEHNGTKMPDEVFCGRLMDFIVRVLRWGFEGVRYYRILGLIYCSEQPTKAVASDVCKAAKAMQGNNLKLAVESAIEILDNLYGIGIPVASKMLRMMSPEKAGAFDDAVLLPELAYTKDDGYPDGWKGYADFCKDCDIVACKLNKQGIKHPKREGHQWLVADVESVLYWRFKHPKEFDKMAR